MIRGYTPVLFGALAAVAVVGCEGKPASAPPVPIVAGEPAKPDESVPADAAGEPEQNLVESGRQQLKDKYTPRPVYSRAGAMGIIRLLEDNVC